jgi:flagellar basal body-associated protein FliL
MNEAAPQAQSATTRDHGVQLKWVVVLVVLVFALGGAVGGVYWWRERIVLHEAPAGSTRHAATSEQGVITFEPFTVNLADDDAPRFLRVSLRLLVDDAEVARSIESDDVRMMRIRSAILELLSQQRAEPLTRPEGKAALRRAIADRVTAILDHTKVTDVLFSEFVVQF